MAGILSGFGDVDLDLEDLIDEDPPPSTRRTPGSADLEVEDKCEALFISATWTLVAVVKDGGGKVVIEQSTPSSKGHTEAFTKRWVRQLIRVNEERLRRMGVDVEKTYQTWGGVLDDLRP
jgi:hypothetical protein